MPEVAIIAALRREIAPLVQSCFATEREHDGRAYRIFERDNAVLICGGIGGQAARRATDAVIALYRPAAVCSAGFAGAADGRLKVGEVFTPRFVIDAADGSRVDTGQGEGILVTFSSIATPEQKAKLAESYGAIAVDMEAAAVARAAAARGVAFTAVKAISDDDQFGFPALESFISSSGEFREGKFALWLLLRPWLVPAAMQLARNSRIAAAALCHRLERCEDLIQPAGQVSEPSNR